jgi:hypothetical protein
LQRGERKGDITHFALPTPRSARIPQGGTKRGEGNTKGTLFGRVLPPTRHRNGDAAGFPLSSVLRTPPGVATAQARDSTHLPNLESAPGRQRATRESHKGRVEA